MYLYLLFKRFNIQGKKISKKKGQNYFFLKNKFSFEHKFKTCYSQEADLLVIISSHILQIGKRHGQRERERERER
jgi:hypothetical protein